MIKYLVQNPFGKKSTYFYLGLSDPIPSLREINKGRISRYTKNSEGETDAEVTEN